MAIVSGGGGGGAGTVTSVTATDASVVVAGSAAAPTIAAADLATIAGLHAAGGPITASGQKITNLGTPTLVGDATTKNYVDAAINGLDWKQPCRLATAAALPANVYANGASGVGATLTGAAFGALSIDGVTPTVGDRILVKNEAAGANNGIYTVTVVGAVATLYVLTRATDYNITSEIVTGTATFVTAGTPNADTAWVMTTTGAITVGTTALVFAQFGAGGSTLSPERLRLAARGLLAESFVAPLTATQDDLDDSQICGSLVALLAGDVATGLVICVENGGTGTLPTHFYAALYGLTGTRLAVSADVRASAALTTTGYQSIPFAVPYTVLTASGFYACLLEVGAFGTNLLTLADAQEFRRVGALGASSPLAVAQAAQTSMPASATFVDGGSIGAGNWFWTGIY